MPLDGITVDARLWPDEVVVGCLPCDIRLHFDGDADAFALFLERHAACQPAPAA